jgi:hypothetical protein
VKDAAYLLHPFSVFTTILLFLLVICGVMQVSSGKGSLVPSERQNHAIIIMLN